MGASYDLGEFTKGSLVCITVVVREQGRGMIDTADARPGKGRRNWSVLRFDSSHRVLGLGLPAPWRCDLAGCQSRVCVIRRLKRMLLPFLDASRGDLHARGRDFTPGESDREIPEPSVFAPRPATARRRFHAGTG